MTTWYLKSLRLSYAWVILDLELSLFRDAVPYLSITELISPLPSPEDLWLAGNSVSWQERLSHCGGQASKSRAQISLRTLFQLFLDNTIARQGFKMSPYTLRLLLYPLHSLVHNCRQLLGCFGDGISQRSTAITRQATLLRMEELQSLLHRWLDLYQTCAATSDETNPSMNAALITYHVLFLNSVTNFTEIEDVARKHFSDSELRNIPNLDARCIQSPDEAVLHAGQILHLLRALQQKARPPWWPAALYRATLILWAYSVFRGSVFRSPAVSSSFTPAVFMVDVQLQDDQVEAFLSAGALHYHPAVTSNIIGANDAAEKTRAVVTVEDPIKTMETCLLAFGEGIATRFSEGIRKRLKSFLDRRIMLGR